MRWRWPRQEGSDDPVRLDLGWLGAAILVAALGGAALYFVVLRSPNAEASQVRGYFASQEHVPPEVLGRLHVGRCDPYPDERGVANYRCTIDFESRRFRVCFGFGNDGVERGPGEFARVPGCDVLAYSRRRNTMIRCPSGAAVARVCPQASGLIRELGDVPAVGQLG